MVAEAKENTMAEPKSIDEMKKSGLLRSGTDPSLVVNRLPFGIPSLDSFLGGGLPLGRCTEVYGPESTGKTLLAQLAVAAVQKTDKPLALLFDMEMTYDQTWWAKSGVDTDKLLVTTPETAEKSIDIMTYMLDDPTLGIIILDSIAAMTPAPFVDEDKSAEDNQQPGLLAKAVSLMYQKIKLKVRDQKVVFFATNQMRENLGSRYPDELGALPGGRSQRHYSQIILRTHREGWIKEGKDNVGYYMEIISKKNKTTTTPDGSSIVLPFLANSQIDLLSAYIEDAVKRNFMTRKGPYYGYNGNNFLGMSATREYFADHPEELENLKNNLL
jgi:recombination protein RecA